MSPDFEPFNSSAEFEPLNWAELDERLRLIVEHEQNFGRNLDQVHLGRGLLADAFQYHAPGPGSLFALGPYRGWGADEVEGYLQWTEAKADEYHFTLPTPEEAAVVLPHLLFTASPDGVLAFARHYNLKTDQLETDFWDELPHHLEDPEVVKSYYAALGLGELEPRSERMAKMLCHWVSDNFGAIIPFSEMMKGGKAFSIKTIQAAAETKAVLLRWGYADPLEVTAVAGIDHQRLIIWVCLRQCWSGEDENAVETKV